MRKDNQLTEIRYKNCIYLDMRKATNLQITMETTRKTEAGNLIGNILFSFVNDDTRVRDKTVYPKLKILRYRSGCISGSEESHDSNLMPIRS